MSNKFKNIKTKEGYEMINLPIFRAKRIDSNEYVIGYLLQDCFGFYIIQTDNALRCETLNQEAIEIDHQTLGISFSDMLDSQRNKIFASLSENGKGGDIIKLDDNIKTAIWCSKTQAIMLYSKQTGSSILSLYKDDIKTIGIQE